MNNKLNQQQTKLICMYKTLQTTNSSAGSDSIAFIAWLACAERASCLLFEFMFDLHLFRFPLKCLKTKYQIVKCTKIYTQKNDKRILKFLKFYNSTVLKFTSIKL